MEGHEAAGVPIAALDVHIGERQMECIQPTDVELCKVRILSDAGGQGAKMKIATWNIDILGYIQGRCSFMDDPERMNIVRHNLKLSYSITEIKRTEDATSAENNDEHATKMIELAPNAAKC